MTPSPRGGSRPPAFLLFTLLLALLPALVVPAGAQDLLAAGSAESDAPARLGLELSMGRVASSSLPGGGGNLWELGAELRPFAPSLGLSVGLRAEGLTQNQPGHDWELRLASRGVEYGLVLGFEPEELPVGIEYHRLDGSALPDYGAAAEQAHGEYVIDGSASHLYSIGHRGRHHRLRVGYGETGLQANAAPQMLGLHGYLPSPRRAQGPFLTLTAERLRVFGFVGRAGAMFILDQRGDRAYSGDFLAWGATLHRALGERMVLGASYVAASSSIRSDALPSMFSLYLRLRWSSTPTQRF